MNVFKNTKPNRWLKIYPHKDFESLPSYLTKMFTFTSKICFVLPYNNDDGEENLKFFLDILSTMFKS